MCSDSRGRKRRRRRGSCGAGRRATVAWPARGEGDQPALSSLSTVSPSSSRRRPTSRRRVCASAHRRAWIPRTTCRYPVSGSPGIPHRVVPIPSTHPSLGPRILALPRRRSEHTSTMRRTRRQHHVCLLRASLIHQRPPSRQLFPLTRRLLACVWSSRASRTIGLRPELQPPAFPNRQHPPSLTPTSIRLTLSLRRQALRKRALGRSSRMLCVARRRPLKNRNDASGEIALGLPVKLTRALAWNTFSRREHETRGKEGA